MLEIFYILLGWLLGILSPGIVNHISNYYKKRGLKRIIITELEDIKQRLVLYPFIIYPKYGKLDENIFHWIKEQSNGFKNLNFDEKRKNEFFKIVQNPELLNDFLFGYNQMKKNETKSSNYKKILLDIINSNLIDFHLLDEAFFKKLLEIRFNINVLNEETQNANEYLKMTFDGNISNENHEIVVKTIDEINFRIADQAINLVEKINLITRK